jgi:hypothetical protein
MEELRETAKIFSQFMFNREPTQLKSYQISIKHRLYKGNNTGNPLVSNKHLL